MKPAREYANPYAAGVALGAVLLASFVIAGRGLGASGAFRWVAARIVPATEGGDLWLVFEIIGVIAGGFVSAALGGRLRRDVERGPRASSRARLACAFGGGAAMGVGAAIARGCTSGLALTGGALLSVGAWAFMIAMFGVALLLAPLMRWEWR